MLHALIILANKQTFKSPRPSRANNLEDGLDQNDGKSAGRVYSRKVGSWRSFYLVPERPIYAELYALNIREKTWN